MILQVKILIGQIKSSIESYRNRRNHVENRVLLGFCLSSIPQFPGNSPSPQLPGNSQIGLGYYKRSFSPLLSLCSLTLASLSCLLAPPLIPSPSPLSPCGHAGLYFSTLSFSLPFSASTTLLTPLPMPWINSILYYTVVWLVSQGEGMPWHGPAETSPSPTLHLHPVEHISSFFIFP